MEAATACFPVRKTLHRDRVQLQKWYKSAILCLDQTDLHLIVGRRIHKLPARYLFQRNTKLLHKLDAIFPSFYLKTEIKRCISLMALCQKLIEI